MFATFLLSSSIILTRKEFINFVMVILVRVLLTKTLYLYFLQGSVSLVTLKSLKYYLPYFNPSDPFA